MLMLMQTFHFITITGLSLCHIHNHFYQSIRQLSTIYRHTALKEEVNEDVGKLTVTEGSASSPTDRNLRTESVANYSESTTTDTHVELQGGCNEMAEENGRQKSKNSEDAEDSYASDYVSFNSMHDP